MRGKVRQGTAGEEASLSAAGFRATSPVPGPCYRLVSAARNHRQCMFLNTSHAFSLLRLLIQSPPYLFFFFSGHLTASPGREHHGQLVIKM